MPCPHSPWKWLGGEPGLALQGTGRDVYLENVLIAKEMLEEDMEPIWLLA